MALCKTQPYAFNGNNCVLSKKIITKNKPKFPKINYILHLTAEKKQ